MFVLLTDNPVLFKVSFLITYKIIEDLFMKTFRLGEKCIKLVTHDVYLEIIACA